MPERIIKNSAYKVKVGIIDDVSPLNIEEGALHVTANELKVHLNGVIKTVSTSAGSSLVNRVIVNSSNASSILGGTIDSTLEYFIDGVIDLGSTEITVPAGGINIMGYNFDLSKLTSSATSYTLFNSPVGGSGNILIEEIGIEITGTSSKVYDIVSDTGFEAIELNKVNYNDCTSLGTIDNYRQGLETGTGRFGGSPNLIFKGTWVGGFRITTSIVRSLSSGFSGALFEAGAGFTMASRFLSDINCDLPASAAFCDFQNSNFTNPSTLQISGAIISRNGVFDGSDSNLFPNITETDLASLFKANKGLFNTYIGGRATISSTAETTISVQGTFVDLAGTFTASSLAHFDSPSTGQLRHIGDTPIEFKLTCNIILDGTSGNFYTIRLTKWDNSATSFVTVLDQQREVLSYTGPDDKATYTIFANTILDENDYVKLQVTNNSGTGNCTGDTSSFLLVEER
jgi:hypothetical protein